QLAADKDSFWLAVRSHVAAQRIETVHARADDLLGQQLVMTGSPAEFQKLIPRFGPQHFFAEFVGEFALQRRLHYAWEFDLARDLLRRLFANVMSFRHWYA